MTDGDADSAAGSQRTAPQVRTPPDRSARSAAPTQMRHLRAVWLLLLMAAVAVVVLVVMNEISKVVGDVAVGARTHSASAVFAPFVGVNSLLEAFGDWAAYVAKTLPALQSWLFVYVALDLIFISLYVLIAVGLHERSRTWRRVPGPAGDETSPAAQPPVPSPVHRWSVLWCGIPIVGAIDATEDVFAILLIRHLPEGPDGFASPSAWTWIAVVGMMLATWLKWGAVVVVVAATIYKLLGLQSRTPVRWLTAFKIQRFSLVIVLLLAVFMVAPGGDIFDQVADVERSWISGISLIQAVFAVVCFGLLAAALWYLGGLRAVRSGLAFTGTTIRIGTTTRKEPNDDNGLVWVVRWLVIPAVLVLLAVTLALFSSARVSWFALIGACTVPAAVVAANAVLLRLKVEPTVHKRLIDPGVTPYVWLIGDYLAVAVCWILGLSIVRSFTALVILDVDRAAALIAVAIGAIVAVAVLPIAWIRFGRQFRDARRPFDVPPSVREVRSTTLRDGISSTDEPPAVKRGWTDSSVDHKFDVTRSSLRWTAFLAFPVAAATLILFPEIVARLGPVGTVALCLALITVGFIALAVVVQWREPLLLFRGLRLDTTPALTLIAIAGLLGATVFDRSPDTHLTRSPDAAEAGPTPLSAWQGTPFAQSVQNWLDDNQTQSCAIDVGRAGDGRAIRVMPLVLVGAAGGGIRAAWWTVNVLHTLADDPCGRHAVLAVSSVSGSSLGMALMLTSKDPIGDAARLGDAAPLSQAVDGLLTRDLFTGLTGINVAAPANDSDYPDRAALLEQSWEQAVPSLSTPFPNPPENLRDPSTAIEPKWQVPWRAFLNTTSARTGCRVVISDVTTEPANAPPANPNCDLSGDSSIPGSYNLFAAQPCLAGMRTSTAALLSSRFPYILPSGLVDSPDCAATTGRDVSDQLIDGGYAENSGLGTLGDLAGQYMPLVRDHNRRQLASSADQITVVVPIVISLDNSPQVTVTSAAPHPPVAETLVPVMSGIRRGATLQNTAALLERTLNQTADWLPCTPIGACSGLAGEIEEAVVARFSARGVEAAPASAPRVAAPLGWAMSAASRAAMDTAVIELLNDCGSNCAFSSLARDLQEASDRGK